MMMRAAIAWFYRLYGRPATASFQPIPAEDFRTRCRRAREVEREGDALEAEALWRDLLAEYPNQAEPARRAGRLLARRVRDLIADRRLNEARSLVEDLPSDLSEALDVVLVRAELANTPAERDTLLQAATSQFPNRVETYRARVRAAESDCDFEAAVGLAEEMTALFPERDESWISLARLLKKSGDAASAERALLTGRNRTKGWRLSRDLASLMLGAGRYDEALAEARAAHAAQPEDAATASILAQTLLKIEGEDAAFAALEPVRAASPSAPNFLRELARLQIATERDAEARETIARLTRELPQAPATLRLRIWAKAKHRDAAAARRLWDRQGFAGEYPALAGDISSLTHLSGSMLPERRLLRLSLVERNARLRLPYFLEHYRTLGVERFVIIDNASDDGSREFLAEQPDVCLFSTEASFAAAASGMRWINGLMDLCPDDHWWLHADVDEFLVLPSRIPSLADHLTEFETWGAEILPAFMLDMFPSTAAEGEAYQAGQNPLEVSPWFDETYRFRGSIEPPFLAVEGGSRDRFSARGSETRPLLVKTALSRRVRYVNSHGTTPGQPAPMRAAFLHFKFIGNFRSQIRSEVVRKEHYNGAAQYALLQSGLERIDADGTWLGPRSRRYVGPADLERLGLIIRR